MINETELMDRIQQVIESVSALSDPFAADIRYHPKCWQHYVSNIGRVFESVTTMDVQSATLQEARGVFFKHVDNVIFVEHEIRSLQSLLNDYKHIVGDYGYSVGEMKSSYLKKTLVERI